MSGRSSQRTGWFARPALLLCRVLLLGLVSGLLSAGFASEARPQASASSASASSFEGAMRAALAARASSDPSLWDIARWRRELTALYAQRGFAPIWFAGGRLSAAGSSLLHELDNAEQRGLLAADYDSAHLRELATAVERADPLAPEPAARADVALSLTATRLASDLQRGRIDPARIGGVLDVARPLFDVSKAVLALATTRNTAAEVDGFEPQLRHYALLKEALARYRLLAAQPQLNALPPLPRTRLLPGDTYSGTPALRELLIALGDLPPTQNALPKDALPADPTKLDIALVAAISRFQTRNGLQPDGVLGRGTYRALTLPFEQRVEQIVLSLERVRWLPRTLTVPPIIVNIPQFRLFAFRKTHDVEQDILQMDVIVGAAFKGRETPVFAADMLYVVLQPYWDVPYSIMRKELLPEIRANPGWVERNHYEIVQGQGDDARPLPVTDQNIDLLAAGKLRLRQQPGPANALGRVKFMLPNRHNVYLHDTPARALFARSRRAFSHGCIRVSDPMALLAHVLRDDPTWTPLRIQEALEGAPASRIPLPHPIPVYIVYGTALATEAGKTLFFDDLYAQDARLTSLLARRRASAVAAVQ